MIDCPHYWIGIQLIHLDGSCILLFHLYNFLYNYCSLHEVLWILWNLDRCLLSLYNCLYMDLLYLPHKSHSFDKILCLYSCIFFLPTLHHHFLHQFGYFDPCSKAFDKRFPEHNRDLYCPLDCKSPLFCTSYCSNLQIHLYSKSLFVYHCFYKQALTCKYHLYC